MTNDTLKKYFEALAAKHKSILSTSTNPKVFRANIIELINATVDYALDYCIVLETQTKQIKGNIDNGLERSSSAFYVLGRCEYFEGIVSKEVMVDNCESIAKDFISKMYNDSITTETVFPDFEIEKVQINEVSDIYFNGSVGVRVEYYYSSHISLDVNETKWND